MTQEAKHTPGPWSWIQSNNSNLIHVETPSDHPIAAGFPIATMKSGGKGLREANANLIAAAPDMLAALENLENDDGKAMPPSAWKMVQDAIAKAKGGAA